MTVLAAPARGSEWFSVYAGSDGFGLSFGSTNWAVWGSTWHDPHWTLSYDAALAGYGEWVWVGGLGRCWRPQVAVGWRPFTHGRWVWTSYGWTWVAYEPWGYFPHHYGHWAYTHHGWVWAPGYSYRPANVVWVSAGGWVGWYPCAPHGWSHAHRGYHRGYRHGYDDGYWDGWGDARHATYTEWRHLGSSNISRHAVAVEEIRRGSSSAQPRTNVSPPARSDLRRRGGIDLPETRMEHRSVVAGDRTITVARPHGMARSVEENARLTADRALAPEPRRRALEAQSSRTVDRDSSRRIRSSEQRSTRSDTARTTRSAREIVAPEGRVERSRPVTQPRSSSRRLDGAAGSRKELSSRRPARVVSSDRSTRRAESSDRKSSSARRTKPRADTTVRRDTARDKSRTERRDEGDERRRSSPRARRR
jgi:hypothetical protein